MRKFLLVVVWVPASMLSLFFSILTLSSYSRVKDGNRLLALQAKEMLPKNGYSFYAALPQVLGSFTTAIAKHDARSEILRQYLNKHNSPLESYSDFIVASSDAYNVDFRLITAISGCESTFGKNMPEKSYNAFGYATYTGQSTGAVFESWEHSIEVMAKYLSERYYSQGLTTPEEMGPIYAPPSIYTGNSWAKCVGQFMDELT